MKTYNKPEHRAQSTAPPPTRALSGFVFNKWTETVVVDLEMAGGDCAECLVLM